MYIIDVLALEHTLRRPLPGHYDHRAPHLLSCRHVFWKRGHQPRDERPQYYIEDPVDPCFRLDAMQWLDEAGTKHVCRFERQLEQSVFSLTFHACPHAAAGTVGARARHVDE